MENQQENTEEITITKEVLTQIKDMVIQNERHQSDKVIRLKDYQIEKLKRERDILKAIVDNGKAIFNWSTIDCDGVHSQGSNEFKTLEEYEEWEEGISDWVEGPFSHELSKESIKGISWGQGWDIN